MLQERYSDHDDTASITKQQATRNNFALESTLVKDYDICIVSIYYLKYIAQLYNIKNSSN